MTITWHFIVQPQLFKLKTQDDETKQNKKNLGFYNLGLPTKTKIFPNLSIG